MFWIAVAVFALLIPTQALGYPYCEQYEDLVTKYFGVEADTALRVMGAESSCYRWAINHRRTDPLGSYGLFQINRYYNEGFFFSGSWHNPEDNIRYAAELQKDRGWYGTWKVCDQIGC